MRCLTAPSAAIRRRSAGCGRRVEPPAPANPAAPVPQPLPHPHRPAIASERAGAHRIGAAGSGAAAKSAAPSESGLPAPSRCYLGAGQRNSQQGRRPHPRTALCRHGSRYTLIWTGTENWDVLLGIWTGVAVRVIQSPDNRPTACSWPWNWTRGSKDGAEILPTFDIPGVRGGRPEHLHRSFRCSFGNRRHGPLDSDPVGNPIRHDGLRSRLAAVGPVRQGDALPHIRVDRIREDGVAHRAGTVDPDFSAAVIGDGVVLDGEIADPRGSGRVLVVARGNESVGEASSAPLPAGSALGQGPDSPSLRRRGNRIRRTPGGRC